MSFVSDAIAAYDNTFLQNEELIELVEKSNNWRSGFVGNKEVNDEIRQSQVHDLDPSTEIHTELVKTFIYYISQYGQKFQQLRINGAEQLRVMKYTKGQFYKPHVDSIDGRRTLSGILYLNDDFDGGSLSFPVQKIEIEPRPGRLVLFPSNFVYIHEAKEVTDRAKYAVVAWFK